MAAPIPEPVGCLRVRKDSPSAQVFPCGTVRAERMMCRDDHQVQHLGIGDAPTVETARRITAVLAPLSARERIRRVVEWFGQDVVMTTSFGPVSGALLTIATEVFPRMCVVTIRHGHETRRTLELAEHFTHTLGLNLHICEQAREPVPPVGTAAFSSYCRRIKVLPLRRALHDLRAQVWISGLMHDESRVRSALPLARLRHGVLAVYPILDWRHQDALFYCLQREIHVNEDYYDPCKGPGQNLECGIHFNES